MALEIIMAEVRTKTMDEINGIIYKAENKHNSMVYIGKTITDLCGRMSRHKYDSIKMNKNNYFNRAIRKYGFDSFSWEILTTTDIKSKLSALEKFYIAAYRKMSKLYNLTDGGDGTSGYKVSDETKKKISISNKGRLLGSKNHMHGVSLAPWNKGKTGIYTEETLSKLHDAILRRGSPMKGRRFPEESKAILSKIKKESGAWVNENNPNYGGLLTRGEKNGMYGKKHSEESRIKMSKSKKGQIPWNKNMKNARQYSELPTPPWPRAPITSESASDRDTDNT